MEGVEEGVGQCPLWVAVSAVVVVSGSAAFARPVPLDKPS